jgi:hypothetical protein
MLCAKKTKTNTQKQQQHFYLKTKPKQKNKTKKENNIQYNTINTINQKYKNKKSKHGT